jgi:hypothetical protein
MTGFHFRLERVLRWRSLELKAEEVKLKRLMLEAAGLESAVLRIQKAISDIPVQIAALPDLHGRDLGTVSAYARHLTRERATITQRRRDKQREITAQAEVHRAAKQRYQLLEELRSRRLSEWQREANVELDYLAHESYLARWKARQTAAS